MFMPVPETHMFQDDRKMMAELIRDEWSLGIGRDPLIEYNADKYLMDSRYGSIFIYYINRSPRVSSVDYNTLHRICNMSFRVSSPVYDYHAEICEEMYRILLANRRAAAKLSPYTFLEITNERHSNDLSGYYGTTISIRLTGYATPIMSAGFGDEVNNTIMNPVDMSCPEQMPHGPWDGRACGR